MTMETADSGGVGTRYIPLSGRDNASSKIPPETFRGKLELATQPTVEPLTATVGDILWLQYIVP